MHSFIILYADEPAACEKSTVTCRAGPSCLTSYCGEKNAVHLAMAAYRLARRTKSGEVAERS